MGYLGAWHAGCFGSRQNSKRDPYMDRPRTDVDRRKRKRWLIAGAAVAAVMAAGIALATFEPMAPRVDAKTLYIDVVTRGDLLRRVRGTGTLVPRDQRWIAAAAEGRRTNPRRA